MNPTLSIENLETLTRVQVAYDAYNLALSNFVPLLKEKLELLDSENGDGISLYTTLIDDLQKLDGTYIQDLIKADEAAFRSILAELGNEIQLDGDKLIVVRGTPKIKRASGPPSIAANEDLEKNNSPLSPRRIAFASLKVYDEDKRLTTGDLSQMTDLQYLFSLNGYHLPGCGSTKERGLYEHFFDNFLKAILESTDTGQSLTDENLDNYRFLVLQDTIFTVHTIVELLVNLIECLLHMVNFIQVRIKSASSMTSLKVILRESDNPVLTFVMNNFNDPERAFVDFASGKLIKINQRKDDLPAPVYSDWTEDFLFYDVTMSDAIYLYQQQCDDCMKNLESLKDRGAVSFFNDTSKVDLIKAFCNNIVVFICEFKNLLKQLKGPLYDDFLHKSLNLLKVIHEVETAHPVKYGKSRSSSSANRSGSSTPRSNDSSPRPVVAADNSLMTNLGKLVSALNPLKK